MGSHLNEDDIQKILKRATELQAYRSQVQAKSTEEDVASVEPSDSDQRLHYIAEAAQELGIGRDVFDLARAEITGSPTFKPVEPKRAARARKWLAHDERFFSLDERIPQAPEAVLDALRETLSGPEYLVEISNMVGEDPFEDGIIIMEPGHFSEQFKPGFTRFKYDMVTADFRQVLITLRKDPTDPSSTILTYYTNLDHSAVMSHIAGRLTNIIMVPLSMGLLLFPILVTTRNPLLTLVAALVGAGLGLIANHAAWKSMYKWGIGKGKKALAEMTNKIKSSFKLKKLQR